MPKKENVQLVGKIRTLITGSSGTEFGSGCFNQSSHEIPAKLYEKSSNSIFVLHLKDKGMKLIVLLRLSGVFLFPKELFLHPHFPQGIENILKLKTKTLVFVFLNSLKPSWDSNIQSLCGGILFKTTQIAGFLIWNV